MNLASKKDKYSGLTHKIYKRFSQNQILVGEKILDTLPMSMKKFHISSKQMELFSRIKDPKMKDFTRIETEAHHTDIAGVAVRWSRNQNDRISLHKFTMKLLKKQQERLNLKRKRKKYMLNLDYLTKVVNECKISCAIPGLNKQFLCVFH